MSQTAPPLALFSHTTPGSAVETLEPGTYRLALPSGTSEHYRCAQLDDYQNIHLRNFNQRAPLCMELSMRVSQPNLTGTWGFGLWNDPFSASQGLGGMSRRLPALPNAAWFFFASPPNYLALRDDHPATGFLAATFSSPSFPSLLLAPAAPFLPLLAFKPAARLLRRLGRSFIRESALLVPGDPCQWRHYSIFWGEDRVQFSMDGAPLFETCVSPVGRLGLVLWIDNQYAAFSPAGALRFGFLDTPQPAWLELKDIAIRST